MSRKKKVLAVASGGGHWVQLLRLRPAFLDCDVVFATTQEDYQSEVPGSEFHKIPDATRWDKRKLLRCAFGIFRLIRKVRPDTIITTGAAPGYFALRIGRLLGIKTVWIDSIANAEELSLSGQKARRCASLWLTQWEHIAREGGPQYFGNVIGELSNGTSTVGEPQAEPAKTDGNRPLGIFVTVGSDVPFDRLLSAVDRWAAETSLNCRIFAQIGESDFVPQNFEYCKFLSATDFKHRLEACDLVVAHAGMGTILSALLSGKRILTLPRHGSLGETRNDHQIATAKHLLKLGVIEVAFDEQELISQLDAHDPAQRSRDISPWASPTFTDKLHAFISE